MGGFLRAKGAIGEAYKFLHLPKADELYRDSMFRGAVWRICCCFEVIPSIPPALGVRGDSEKDGRGKLDKIRGGEE